MRTSPRRTQLFTLRDFTGGLNLVSDTFRLAANESPDMMNVDVDRRGGFQLRNGIQPYSPSFLEAFPEQLWSYHTTSTDYVLAQVGAKVFQSTGTTWTQVGSDLGSSTTHVCPVTFNNKNYWSRGNTDVVRWDSISSASLTAAFNDTTTPTSGNVPRAEHLAVHSGYLWAAGTYESGTHYPNRVRWSWANTFDNSGENWRTNDYIDLDDGKDGDAITAIVPFRDHLVVFKRDSVYGIYGYSAESFQVVNISNTIGALNHDCALNTPAGLFFFSHTNGLNVWDGKGVTWVFEQIWPALRDGSIPSGLLDNVRMGWVRNRLWLSVPWDTDPTIPRLYTFVFDPFVNKGGAWTRYDLQAGPYLRNHRLEQFLAALWGASNLVFKLDVNEHYMDDYGPELGVRPIDAYLRTRWVDLDQPAVKKRWRRLEAVLQVETPYELPVVAYGNYNPSVVRKNFKFTPRIGDDTESDEKWDTATWRGTASGVDVGDMKWSVDNIRYGEVDRGANLGVARAVSVKVGGPVLSAPDLGPQVPVLWGCDSLIFKFVPRRVR